MTVTLEAARPVTKSTVAARLAEPAGLSGWRQNALFRERVLAPSPQQVRQVIAGVRLGAELVDLAEESGLTCDRVMDVVVGVGSRISQANKRGPKVDVCLSRAAGAERGLEPGSHVDDGGKITVVLARGWDRTAAHGRDVSRAYGAMVLSDAAADERPIERWLGTLACEQPLTYGHFAHLYSVATGKMQTLEGISDDPDVQEAYLRAFDVVADAVARASAAVTLLCRPGVRTSEIPRALQQSFWMLGEIARRIHAQAGAAHAGDERARKALDVTLSQLRSAVARTPARFFPRALQDLSVSQFRAICARAGFPVQELQDAAREEVDLSDLTNALLAVRARMDAGMDLEAAADEVSRLAALWRGDDA